MIKGLTEENKNAIIALGLVILGIILKLIASYFSTGHPLYTMPTFWKLMTNIILGSLIPVILWVIAIVLFFRQHYKFGRSGWAIAALIIALAGTIFVAMDMTSRMYDSATPSKEFMSLYIKLGIGDRYMYEGQCQYCKELNDCEEFCEIFCEENSEYGYPKNVKQYRIREEKFFVLDKEVSEFDCICICGK